jgi:uridine phosphorylase
MEKQPHLQIKTGDIGETVIIPGDVSRAKIIAEHFDSAELVASNRQFNTFTGMYKGVKVSVTSTGIGGAAAAITIEELVKAGAKNVIRVGTGGMFQTWLPRPAILVITGAVSGDGISREYFPRGFPAVADFYMVENMLLSAEELGVEVHAGYEWSHDSFYRGAVMSEEDLFILDIEKEWIDAGVLIASQEASTVFTLSTARKVRGGVILASAGHHQTPNEGASEEEMVKTISDATKIALETAVKLDKLDHGDK